MNLFTTIDVVYTRMKRDTRIEIPVYKLIHVRKYTCLKPYVLQIIRVWNHTRYKSYALQIIRVWNHTRYKSYAYEIIRVTNHTRMKLRHFIGRSATHPCLTKPSQRTSSCFASRRALCDVAVMRPWRSDSRAVIHVCRQSNVLICTTDSTVSQPPITLLIHVHCHQNLHFNLDMWHKLTR